MFTLIAASALCMLSAILAPKVFSLLGWRQKP
jgi:hypothetical protein